MQNLFMGPKGRPHTKTYWLTDRRSQIQLHSTPRQARVEASQNTSTVAMRVIRGDRKGTQSQMRQGNMVSSSVGLGPERDSAGKAEWQLYK
jgi:hypothetical protein